jgi:hypothetical protein
VTSAARLQRLLSTQFGAPVCAHWGREGVDGIWLGGTTVKDIVRRVVNDAPSFQAGPERRC